MVETVAGRRVSGVQAIRDRKAAPFYELAPTPECDYVVLTLESRAESEQNSPGDNNPAAEFLTVGRGYEGARHFVSLVARFDRRVVHTT
jgi:hypothetical protein